MNSVISRANLRLKLFLFILSCIISVVFEAVISPMVIMLQLVIIEILEKKLCVDGNNDSFCGKIPRSWLAKVVI